jgi:hypothetical protein
MMIPSAIKPAGFIWAGLTEQVLMSRHKFQAGLYFL